MAGSVEPDAGRDETDAGRDETDPGIHQADRRDEAPWREQRAAPEFREESPSAAHRHGNRRRGVARRRPRRLAHHPAAHALRGVDRSPPSDARGGLDCHRAPRIGGVGRRPSPPTVGRASAAAAARRHSRRGCDAGDAPARGARGCSHQGKAGQGRNEQVRQHALTAPAVLAVGLSGRVHTAEQELVEHRRHIRRAVRHDEMVRRGKHREPRVREQVLHLHGMLDTDDVAIAHY